MEEKFTLKQVLMMTCDMLSGIGTIPIEEAEHIGVPVSRAIANLKECIKVMNEGEKQMAEQAQEAENSDDCGE